MWHLPLFGLCTGLEKKWDFYSSKRSNRTPSRGWTNSRATACKHAGRPKLCGLSAAASAHGGLSAFPGPLFTVPEHTGPFQCPLGEQKNSFSHASTHTSHSLRQGCGGECPAKRPIYGPRRTEGMGLVGWVLSLRKLGTKHYAPQCPNWK